MNFNPRGSTAVMMSSSAVHCSNATFPSVQKLSEQEHYPHAFHDKRQKDQVEHVASIPSSTFVQHTNSEVNPPSRPTVLVSKTLQHSNLCQLLATRFILRCK